MSTSEQYSAEDLFSKWLAMLRVEQERRYLHSERPELVEELAVVFKKYGIDYDDAKGFKNKVIHAMTTEEGRKDRGRYKGWKDAVKEDYLCALANVYIDSPEEGERNVGRFKSKDKIVENTGSFLPKSEIITAWGVNKYGGVWTERMDSEARKIDSRLNIQFQEEVLFAPFASDSNNFPCWLKSACKI